MEKNTKKTKKQIEEEEEEEEEVEEVEEEAEEEDQIGEDFSKDPRAFTYVTDAGKIADSALNFAINLSIVGAEVYDICFKTDDYILEQLQKIYTKKKFIKGIAFPTSVSVNELCGHYSPTKEEGVPRLLVEGDLIKIDLGVQINGFAAVVAHTIVLSSKTVSGRQADVVLAAYNAIQSSLRNMYPGKNTNSDITNIISSVATDYNVTPVEGVLSHRMKRDIIDGMEVIINHETYDQKVEKRTFEHGDVFGLDVIVSTGEGKPKETEFKTTVFKRALETTYKLKTESGRKLLSVVEQNFHTFPFSFNQFDIEERLHFKNQIVKYF